MAVLRNIAVVAALRMLVVQDTQDIPAARVENDIQQKLPQTGGGAP